MSKPNIEKMLTLSTAHLPREFCDNIDKDLKNKALTTPLLTAGALVYPHGQYGYLVFIGNTPDVEAELQSWPFAEAAAIAKNNGCCWLLFDRDADIHDDIIVYDW